MQEEAAFGFATKILSGEIGPGAILKRGGSRVTFAYKSPSGSLNNIMYLPDTQLRSSHVAVQKTPTHRERGPGDASAHNVEQTLFPEFLPADALAGIPPGIDGPNLPEPDGFNQPWETDWMDTMQFKFGF